MWWGERVLSYFYPMMCDGCGKTKIRVISDDGRQILCRRCRKDPEYRQYLKDNYGI